MSGPSLARRETHHAIHQAAFDEAEHLTRLLRQAVLSHAHERALQLVGALIEHWDTRILQHAEAEESGWYREVVAARPELQADVLALARDHGLLRILFAEIQGILARRDTLAGVCERFEAMLLVNAIHSREEERRLLGDEQRPDGDCPPNASLVETAPAPAPSGPAEGAIPLAVAQPALYAQLVRHLRTAGLHPGDLAVDVARGPDGVMLRVRSGDAFSRTKEWPLTEGESADAIEALLDEVTAFCSTAAADAYRRAMHLSM